jgi:hypothetical protein
MNIEWEEKEALDSQRTVPTQQLKLLHRLFFIKPHYFLFVLPRLEGLYLIKYLNINY